MLDKTTEQRVTCSRHHLLFNVTVEGIAIKCRAGECRTVYTISWDEIEAKRVQASDINSANEGQMSHYD